MIIHGDCLAEMKKMPAESVGIVVTSPPYNIAASFHNSESSKGWYRKMGKGQRFTAQGGGGYDEHDDDMPAPEYNRWQNECLREMWRLTKPTGAIFYNHKWRVRNGVMQRHDDILGGLPVRQIIIWSRPGGFNGNPGFFMPTYEVIYLIAKPEFRLVKGANGAGDVWRFNEERNNPHPCPSPPQIPARCIESIADNGAVLDPFLGSGTTAIAAINAGREWIGIEKSAKYCDMARARIATATPPLI